jgi:GNAT superfamily N-acetyltransferase
VHYVIIRDAKVGEYPLVGELRVAAYQARGLLPEGIDYAQTLRGFGFDGVCAVLVAVDEADSGILGTVALEPFGPASELARDETEADLRAFAVAPAAQGRGVGRELLAAAIERACAPASARNPAASAGEYGCFARSRGSGRSAG